MVVNPEDTVDLVGMDPTGVEVLVEAVMDPVETAVVEDPVVTAVTDHLVVQAMDRAAMVVVVVVAAADSHSHPKTSTQCPLQRLRFFVSNLT